jgi:hypothetical protein
MYHFEKINQTSDDDLKLVLAELVLLSLHVEGTDLISSQVQRL